MALYMEVLRKKTCFFHAEIARTQKMLIELGLVFLNLLVNKFPIAGDTFLFLFSYCQIFEEMF